MAIRQYGLQNKLTKLYNYGHKISKRFTQADYSNTKAHTPSLKLERYRDICWLLGFSSTSLVLITVVSLAINLLKRPGTLARYYVTLHWRTEWVKKRRRKKIVTPPSPEPYIYMQKWSSKHTSSLCKAILKCLKNRYSFSSSSPSKPAYFSIASYPNESNDRSGFRSRHVGVLLVWPPCSFTQSMFINIVSLPWSLIKDNANPLYVVPKSIATTARYVDFGE